MATKSAGTAAVGTTESTIFEDDTGVSSVFVVNGSSFANNDLSVHVDGLHADGDFIVLPFLGFGSQLVSYAIFTIRPRGIKKITAKYAVSSGTVYFQTVEV